MFDKLDIEHVTEDDPVWEKMVRKLRTASMPPAGMPRPDKAEVDSMVSYLEAALDRAAAVTPNPGRPAALHRLNRAEYTNAIRDLLGIDTDAIDIPSLLPPDDSSYGFDNNGDVLSVSPLRLEKYLAAARKISRLAVGDPAISPSEETYVVPRYLVQDDRQGEDLPFGSRGGISIRNFFPLDGEYFIRIRLKRTYDNLRIVGDLTKHYRLDVRLDGKRIKLLPLGGEPAKAAADSPAAVTPEATGGQTPTQAKASAASKSEPVTPPMEAGLEVRLPVSAGTHRVGVTFLKDDASKREVIPRRRDATSPQEDEPAVGSITIGGPYAAKGPGSTPSRRQIFICQPTGVKSQEPCARKILSVLARRAYRRPVTSDDIQALLSPYEKAGKRSFDAGIEAALRAILVSPDFLFRIERDPPGAAPETAYRVSDLELASRLSFFLWSSIPDDKLLGLAEAGKLHDTEVLEQQVRRMLADRRADALAVNFAGQWLYLRNIDKVYPDPKEYPDFDENLRQAFQRETELFFGSMLREDRGVLDLLDANYTFVNERLARHYGISNVYGNHFRRVTLADENRKGLLGQGSILTVTSYANRTSPTLRGKWLLENILGSPPPPPPGNVPSLKDRDESGRTLSVRQQLEHHRANPACAVCHARMDPLGFALENFDGTGKWRTTSGPENTPIDSSGVLPEGTKFNGPAELRRILLQRREQFVLVVTEKLLTYALGRGVEHYDEPAAREILRQAAPGNYRWSSIVQGIIKSTPFQMRRSRSL